MNKVATLGLAFLLIFSGCLGFGEDDTPEQEEKDTVEPVGENDLEGLENDVNLLTSRLDAEVFVLVVEFVQRSVPIDV